MLLTAVCCRVSTEAHSHSFSIATQYGYAIPERHLIHAIWLIDKTQVLYF
jgi:hypothetical protein